VWFVNEITDTLYLCTNQQHYLYIDKEIAVSKYTDMKINDLINDSIIDFKRTRTNRLRASERLKKYKDRWDRLTFFLNVSAVIITMIALIIKTDRFEHIASIYSIYVILLQYYLATLDYNNRSLKLHYEQLELNDLRTELKLLLINNDLSDATKLDQYNNIFDKYQTSLRNNENHSKLDDTTDCRKKDFSFDNIFINVNILVLFIISLLEIYLCLSH